MTAIRPLGRVVAVLGVTFCASFVAASPAQAADASCQLTRLPSRMTAGSSSGALVGFVRSADREILPVAQVTWRVRLSGLGTDEVSISGLDLSEDDDEIVGTEQIRNVSFRGQSVSHTLRFLPGAPSGNARVTMEVFVSEDGDLKDACSSRVSTQVQGVRGTPTPTPEVSLDTALPPQTGVAGASTDPAAAGVAAPPSGGDSSLWPLYVLGLLLVAGGGGLVAVLLLRRPRDEEQPAAYVSTYGYPRPPHSDAPTAIIPAVRDDRPHPY